MEPRLWALTPVRLVGHWVVVAALFAVTITVPVLVFREYGDEVSGVVGVALAVFAAVVALGFAYGTFTQAIKQLRAGTAVWIHPRDNAVTVFRATGRALRTTPNRVQRVDRGGGRRDAQSPHSPLSSYPPLRIVTADGTAHLTPLLGPVTEIADAIAAHNPRIQVDL